MSNYNKPYKLDYACNIQDRYFALYDHKKRKTEDVLFMSGEKLPKPDQGQLQYSQDPSSYDLIYNVGIDIEKVIKYDYLPAYTPAPIVSTRTLNLLKILCPDDFQAFSVIIESNNKIKVPFVIENEYWLINITKLVDTIDLEQSVLVFNEEKERIRHIRHLVFKEGVMQDGSIHLARERLYRPHIMVSPALKEAFQKHKIKGCEFVTDETYNRESFNR